MKTILSTGLGRLYLVQSAVHLERQGVDINLVQGWIPKNPDSWLVRLLSRVAGRSSLASGFKKRRPEEFKGKIVTCAFSEFLTQLLFLVSSKTELVSRSRAASWGWQLFGLQTKQYLTNADIFHVRSGAGQGGAIARAKKLGMKVIVDHSIAHPVFMENVFRDEYEEVGQRFDMGPSAPVWSLILKDCTDSDLLMVNSDFVKLTFINAGFPPEKIEVASQGARADFRGLKQDYSLPPVLRLLFTGSFGIRKGAKYILKALQILDKLGTAYEFTVVGTDAEAKELIKKYPVRGKVRLLGHIPQDELGSFLANSDIYIFPSLSEGLASSLLEALSAGLPVIATFESGARLIDGEQGCVVPAKDPQAIADKVVWLKENPDRYEKIGRAGAQLVKENYTWEHYACTVKEIYEKCLEEKG